MFHFKENFIFCEATFFISASKKGLELLTWEIAEKMEITYNFLYFQGDLKSNQTKKKKHWKTCWSYCTLLFYYFLDLFNKLTYNSTRACGLWNLAHPMYLQLYLNSACSYSIRFTFLIQMIQWLFFSLTCIQIQHSFFKKKKTLSPII